MPCPSQAHRSVFVTAPGRLHFGLFSFHSRGAYDFGGVGVMVDRPQTRIRVRPSRRFTTVGPQQDRMRRCVARAVRAWGLDGPPSCCVELVDAPRPHIGLGSGTQLSLSIVAGLNAFLGRPPLDAASLARVANRGLRSAVGTHGFLSGGLILDRGKRNASDLGTLACRVPLPDAWRFVLVLPRDGEGLSGAAERQAFERLPAVPPATTERLVALADEALIPTAAAGDFLAFGEALYEYGRLAGQCFAACQGGPFASPRLARLVQWIRRHGVRGVGQSSWGPAIFALLPERQAAETFVAALQREFPASAVATIITPTNRSGARIETATSER